MKHCLITGLTGFVGSHVARLLVRSGWQVHGLKRSTSSLVSLQDVAERIAFHDLDREPLDETFAKGTARTLQGLGNTRVDQRHVGHYAERTLNPPCKSLKNIGQSPG